MSLIGCFTPLPAGPCIFEVYCMERQSPDWCAEVEAKLRAELDERDRPDIRIVFCQPGVWLRIRKRGWLASLFRS